MQIATNKPVYLSLSILELSKIVMYELFYDYFKQKYEKSNIMLRGYRQLYSRHKNRKIFTQTLWKVVKQDLIPQTMKKTDHYRAKKEKQKSNWFNER